MTTPPSGDLSLDPADGRVDRHGLGLPPGLALAVDDFFEARHSDAGEERRGPTGHSAQSDAVASLLALLDTSPPRTDARSLAEQTLLRIETHGRPAAIDSAEPTLSVDDAESLDALVMQGFDPGRVPGMIRSRAYPAAAIGDLLRGSSHQTDRWLEAGRETRTENVLAAIDDSGPASIPFTPAAEKRGLRLADVGAIAAMLLVAVSVFFPVAGRVRETQIQGACLANFGSTAAAFDQYAADHDDSLPMAAASIGSSWIRVGAGPGHSNSANLFTVVRAGYAPLEELACPGNPDAPSALRPGAMDWRSLEEVSYSYRLVWGAAPRRWHIQASDLIVLSDRSPVVLRAVRRDPIVPEENSPNHRERGQHALRFDGSASWVGSPVLDSGDNIWLPRQVERAIRDLRIRVNVITGGPDDLPESPDDVFLGP